MLPQTPFSTARARDTAPDFFDNLLRIRGISESHTHRTNALRDFAAREAERQAQMQAQRQQQQQINGMIGSIGNFSSAPSNVSGNVALARRLAAAQGWGGNQWNALYQLGMRESGWRNTAQNPTSTAYGIGQFLDSTWGTVGGRKTSDPNLQIQYMLKYIAQRYGNPANAMNFWNRNHWY